VRYYPVADYLFTDDLEAGLAGQGATSRFGSGHGQLPLSMRDRVPFLLYRAAEASHALANQMLAEVGLAARQAGILTMVSELGPMTQKALADALRIDRTTMVALIDDLEQRGLVVRKRHPRDRRAFLICPTDAGRAAKETAVAILDEQQRRFLAPLTQQERIQLGELLNRLYASARSAAP
jgi:MarR family transcriptional regulator, lower aerobic nicotinate degradation pathway regulator